MHEPLITYLKQEIEIHSKLDHFFLCQYIASIKDSSRIYILNEYTEGCLLSEIIPLIPIDSESYLKFYMSCLVEIISYLENKSIIHRGLNPENIIMDKNGYLILKDFSLSTICKDRHYTVLGIPYYMPPEMINNKGYCIRSNY